MISARWIPALLLATLLLAVAAPAALAQDQAPGAGIPLPPDEDTQPLPDDRDMSGLDLATEAVAAAAAADFVDIHATAQVDFLVESHMELGRLRLSGSAIATADSRLRGETAYTSASYRLVGAGLLIEGTVRDLVYRGRHVQQGPDGAWTFIGPAIGLERPEMPGPEMMALMASHPAVKAVRQAADAEYAGQMMQVVEVILDGTQLVGSLQEYDEDATATLGEWKATLWIDPESALLRRATLTGAADVTIPSESLRVQVAVQADVTVTPRETAIGLPSIDWNEVDYTQFLSNLAWRVRYSETAEPLPTTGRMLTVSMPYREVTGQEVDLQALARMAPDLADGLAAVPPGWALVVETREDEMDAAPWISGGRITAVLPPEAP